MSDSERISESDRALLARLTARQREMERAAGELQALVQEHLSAIYSLKPGDRIEDDGAITRATPETADAAAG